MFAGGPPGQRLVGSGEEPPFWLDKFGATLAGTGLEVGFWGLRLSGL